MAKLTNRIIKMFALTSCIGATIKTAEHAELRMLSLNNQCNKAMKVFHVKAGRATYYGTAKIVQDIWEKLQDKHDTTIHHEKLGVFIELLCMLVPPTDFKAFIGISPYRSKVSVTDKEFKEMSKLALDLDFELNKVFGTSPYAITKPKIKTQKVKKQRDKKRVSKPKEKTISKGKAKRIDRNKRVSSFLKNKVATAKMEI